MRFPIHMSSFLKSYRSKAPPISAPEGPMFTFAMPQSEPVVAPPYKEEGSPELAALYRFDFWKMDLGAFTGRGQGGPRLTDAAQ